MEDARSKVAVVRKVREPFGILGNMSRHPVTYNGLEWRTTEALFQALRFAADDPVREAIRAEKSPMSAKFKAKGNADKMLVTQLSKEDLDNMRLCLLLKYEAHEDVRECLFSTVGKPIVEDCTNRQRGSGLFWGAALRDGEWVGDNWLGVLWMELRDTVRS
jgi:ribA/ribD-fused uncharacterized protein